MSECHECHDECDECHECDECDACDEFDECLCTPAAASRVLWEHMCDMTHSDV